VAKARVFLAVKGGVPVDAVMWDGETAYTHPDADQLVAEEDWRGPKYVGPPDPPDLVAQRTAEDRLRTIRRHLNDDLAAIDGATLAQLRPILRRIIRAQRLLIRMAVADPATSDDDTGA